MWCVAAMSVTSGSVVSALQRPCLWALTQGFHKELLQSILAAATVSSDVQEMASGGGFVRTAVSWVRAFLETEMGRQIST